MHITHAYILYSTYFDKHTAHLKKIFFSYLYTYINSLVIVSSGFTILSIYDSWTFLNEILEKDLFYDKLFLDTIVCMKNKLTKPKLLWLFFTEVIS